MSGVPWWVWGLCSAVSMGAVDVLSKRALRERTETTVQTLQGGERAQEIARMLGGPGRSATPLQHAAELLEAASRLKKRMKVATPSG